MGAGVSNATYTLLYGGTLEQCGRVRRIESVVSIELLGMGVYHQCNGTGCLESHEVTKRLHQEHSYGYLVLDRCHVSSRVLGS